MRTARLAFKYALRQCKCLEDTMRANALATFLLSKDTNSFWKHVSVSRNKKVCTLTKVDDCVGVKEITDMSRNHLLYLIVLIVLQIKIGCCLISTIVLANTLLSVFLLMMLAMVSNTYLCW